MDSERPELATAIQASLGQPVDAVAPLASGAGGDAHLVTLRSGTRVVVKVGRGSPPDLFDREAAGLSWLAEASAIRVPHVLAVRHAAPAFIAMEFIEAGPRSPTFERDFGRQLAELHRHHPPRFGLDCDNFIGPLPQHNAPASGETFADFYAERRLIPLLDQVASGVLERSDHRAVESTAATLADRIPVESPARLHGDLWAGNRLVGPQGEPVLIDPAVYGGHREMDLAMMQLFGGFGAEAFAAYDEAYPLEAGWRARTPLMQLYPLLVHCALFGRAYVGQLRTALEACNGSKRGFLGV